jgi:sulfur-oxidizing protein SoxY
MRQVPQSREGDGLNVGGPVQRIVIDPFCNSIAAGRRKHGGCTRRALLTAAVAGGAGLAGVAAPLSANDDAAELVEQLTGKTATDSDRIQLIMPRQFPTGSAVPLTLVIGSPMTEADHVRQVRLLAPRNPLIEVAQFNFTPGRSGARVSTRIRLAQPQHVVAVAEMSDGRLLMTKTWVEVGTDGCLNE